MLQLKRFVSHHVSLLSGDDLLRTFWEVEEAPTGNVILSAEEKAIVQQFEANHSCADDGRFIVPLPKKPNADNPGHRRSGDFSPQNVPSTRRGCLNSRW